MPSAPTETWPDSSLPGNPVAVACGYAKPAAVFLEPANKRPKPKRNVFHQWVMELLGRDGNLMADGERSYIFLFKKPTSVVI